MRQARKPGQGFQNPTDPDLLREYARKGAAGNRAASRGAGTWIEGEYVTTAQIAERLGVSRKTAVDRLSRARRLPGAVTWDRLRGKA
jgi:hypothetical protein